MDRIAAAPRLGLSSPSLFRYVRAFWSWLATLLLLMSENFGDRYRRSRLANLLAILEPLGVILLFSLTHLFMPTEVPPFGSSTLLFHATGILPFYLFFHVSWRIRLWDSMHRLPRLTGFDMMLAHVLSEIVMKMAVMYIIFFALWFYGVKGALPRDFLESLYALIFLALLGLGVGLVNAVITTLFFAWTYAYAILIRAWMVFSGVFFVMDYAPKKFRDFAVYNPVADGITWYRYAHYHAYPSLTLDVHYMILFTGCSIALGLLMERASRSVRAIK